jgi:hypothetical protein
LGLRHRVPQVEAAGPKTSVADFRREVSMAAL